MQLKVSSLQTRDSTIDSVNNQYHLELLGPLLALSIILIAYFITIYSK